jgi:hypothetical protein
MALKASYCLTTQKELTMFEVDFNNGRYDAHTLAADEVCLPEDERYGVVLSRLHADGWLISGVVYEDYVTWVNDFEAVHEVYGRVWGNFEDKVFADNEAGYQHFFLHHTPESWDYGDI